MVNTLFSCLCTLDDSFSFVPRWRPPFVTELAGQDRCHLNGLAMRDGRPQFVTAHGNSNEPAGWRSTKASSGCVIDVPSGQTLVRGLCMPHSPRWYNDRLWALDSGTGRLIQIDPANGGVQTIEQFPGYTRGLAFSGQFAFVGLSRIRETLVFGGIPLADKRDELRCAIAVVDLALGRAVARLEFYCGVEEIFAVCVLSGCRNPVLGGPSAEEDGRPDIWVVPPEGREPSVQPAARGLAASLQPAVSQPPPKRHVSVQQLAREATVLHRQGRLVETLERLKIAVETAPGRGDLWNELGNVYQELDDQEAAMTCYRRAAQVQPGLVAAYQNLGYLAFNFGEPNEALRHYQEAQRLGPSPMNRLLVAGVLPVVYDSAAEVCQWRNRYAAGVRQMVAEGLRIDTTRTLLPTAFFLAYQGLNDRDLAGDLGKLFQGLELCPAAGGPLAGRERSRSASSRPISATTPLPV